MQVRQEFDRTNDKDDLLSAAFLPELHEASPIQSSGQALTAITGSPTHKSVPKDNVGTKPHVHAPEPEFVPVPIFPTFAEAVVIGSIPSVSDEAQMSPGCHRSCSSELQQLVEADLRDECWRITRAALANGNTYDNASSQVAPHKHGIVLMLSNLPCRTKFSEVVEILKKHGCYDCLMSSRMPTHRAKRHNKRTGCGYLFLRFSCCQAALQCFDAFNGRCLGHKKCVVKLADEQDLLGHHSTR